MVRTGARQVHQSSLSQPGGSVLDQDQPWAAFPHRRRGRLFKYYDRAALPDAVLGQYEQMVIAQGTLMARTNLVEVEFRDLGDGGTHVVLTNRGLVDEEARRAHREGWQASLDNLERVFER